MSVPIKRKLATVYQTSRFRPRLGVAILLLSLGSALLEGAGLGFLLPILQLVQSSSPPAESGRLLQIFTRLYSTLGIPFTLEYLISGVALAMMFRFAMSFCSAWAQGILRLDYKRHLRQKLFDSLMYAPIEYIDRVGSDELLNSLITETNRSSGIVMSVFGLAQVVLRGIVYLAIATVLSPSLTLVAVVSLSASTIFVRYVLEPAYRVGTEIAETNDQIQTLSQSGIQGMRDIRLYNMRERLIDQMQTVLSKYVSTGVRLRRNQSALNSLNQFLNAVVVFALVYVGFTYTSLTLSELGVFLFAVFRLSPVVNQINSNLYRLDGRLPHLIRIFSRLEEIDEMDKEVRLDGDSVESVDRIRFEDVSFGYPESEKVLQDISFDAERGDKIAFVGKSGAGKSTIVSLIGRLQTVDSGQILADGVSIGQYDLNDWRDRLAIVRQDPFLFDDTLRENLLVGNRDASEPELRSACDTAQVTEFLAELPHGYDTELGENGVRLSGGQKQRVAIARALLKDADILILDEATSELDSNIEKRVYEGIQSLKDQYITITIAHRLSTVSDADRIYTLVDGSIAEVGTHAKLIENEGIYADLHAIQS